MRLGCSNADARKTVQSKKTRDWVSLIRVIFTVTPLTGCHVGYASPSVYGNSHDSLLSEIRMRNLGLDLLRLAAVLLVIVRHLHLPDAAPAYVTFCQRGGWVGVDLFFVLSGFLVSSLLFAEFSRHGTIDITRFLVRRGFKIYPSFWLFLLASIMVKQRLGQHPNWSEILSELLFVQNYLQGIWSYTWSLAVEEHFYVGIAGLFGLLLMRERGDGNPFRTMPAIFAGTTATCLALRVLNLVLFPEYAHRPYLFGTHIRIDSLMFGVLLAYLSHFRRLDSILSRVSTPLLLATGAVSLSPAFIFELETNRWLAIVGVMMFYVGGGCFLVAALRLQSSQSSVLNLMGGVGAASYSIYLWHMPVATWGYGLLRRATGVQGYYLYAIVAVVGACTFGWLLNRLIESPVLWIRDRLFPMVSTPTKRPGLSSTVMLQSVTCPAAECKA